MREQEIKLANVKKSCSTTGKVAKVLGILMAVIAVVMLVGGIVMIACKSNINSSIKTEEVSGKVVAHVFSENGTELFSLEQVEDMGKHGILGMFNVVGILMYKGMAAEALAAVFFSTAVAIAILAGIFIIIMKVFKLIENSDSPFNGDVMKKLKTAFIIITVYTLFAVGLGAAALAGVVFWSLYCILDYGYVLQKESDETL